MYGTPRRSRRAADEGPREQSAELQIRSAPDLTTRWKERDPASKLHVAPPTFTTSTWNSGQVPGANLLPLGNRDSTRFPGAQPLPVRRAGGLRWPAG